jgi:hypothetical protein
MFLFQVLKPLAIDLRPYGAPENGAVTGAVLTHVSIPGAEAPGYRPAPLRGFSGLLIPVALASVLHPVAWASVPARVRSECVSPHNSLTLQNSALPGVRGNGITSRMLAMPVA